MNRHHDFDDDVVVHMLVNGKLVTERMGIQPPEKVVVFDTGLLVYYDPSGEASDIIAPSCLVRVHAADEKCCLCEGAL